MCVCDRESVCVCVRERVCVSRARVCVCVCILDRELGSRVFGTTTSTAVVVGNRGPCIRPGTVTVCTVSVGQLSPRNKQI